MYAISLISEEIGRRPARYAGLLTADIQSRVTATASHVVPDRLSILPLIDAGAHDRAGVAGAGEGVGRVTNS